MSDRERYDKGKGSIKIGRDMIKERDQLKGSIKIFEHTSRGSKLINLYDAFE